jgi:pimeloyl-ACP methyl ester carboxylesterase
MAELKHAALSPASLADRWRPAGKWQGGWIVRALAHSLSKRHELLAGLRATRCPTLVLRGSESQVDAAVAAGITAAATTATLRTIDGAGHWPWLEKPEAVSAVLEGFLRDHA